LQRPATSASFLSEALFTAVHLQASVSEAAASSCTAEAAAAAAAAAASSSKQQQQHWQQHGMRFL